MATSFFPPSTSFNNYRVNQGCVNLHSGYWQKGIRCFSVCLQKQKWNWKFYIMTNRNVSVHFVLKTFAATGSLEADVACNNQDSSDVSAPNNFLRSEKMADCSSNPFDGMSDFERQLQELFNKIRTMILKGDKSDAIDLLQANYEAVKEQMNTGSKGIEEAAILDIIALGYTLIGDLKFVRSLLSTMNGVVDIQKDDEPLLGSILMHMGSMYSTLGDFEKSMLAYRRVILISESKYGRDSTFLIKPLLGMAKSLGSIGRATKALDIYERVINIIESSRGAKSEDLVVPLFGLGNLLMRERKATDAEGPFTRILKIYTKLYGEKDGRVGLAMCSLARVKFAKGNTDEAIDLYKNALQIIKDSSYMDLDDGVMENMRIELAELLHVVGRWKEGQELLEECLLITEKFKGKDHPSLATHYQNLATSYSRLKNFAMAEHLLRASMDVISKAEGPDHPSITFPMLHLAVTLYHLKRDEEAEQLALEALHIREKAFGKDSLPVGEALDCLVSIQGRRGKHSAELLELLRRVLKIQEKEFGYESKEVMVTLKKVVFYLNKLGRKDEKFPLQRRLSTLRKKYKHIVQY
ncbi:hypothetical protein SLA2020_218900 [Shorea laevis]